MHQHSFWDTKSHWWLMRTESKQNDLGLQCLNQANRDLHVCTMGPEAPRQQIIDETRQPHFTKASWARRTPSQEVLHQLFSLLPAALEKASLLQAVRLKSVNHWPPTVTQTRTISANHETSAIRTTLLTSKKATWSQQLHHHLTHRQFKTHWQLNGIWCSYIYGQRPLRYALSY